jgi:uncharacterized repeat protein (TIGR01451 family)
MTTNGINRKGNRIMRLSTGAAFALLALTAAPAFGAGLSLTNTVMAQQRATAADGTTRITLVPATRVGPGDRVVYQIGYKNGGAKPVDNLVLNNPLPAELAYRGPAPGSPAPELSIDGKTFGPLASLKAHGIDGTWRPARIEDVTHVRWILAAPIPAGASGKVSFEAVVR